MKVAVAVLASVAVLITAAPALARTQSATLGQVSASLTYKHGVNTDLYTGKQLTITRAGQQVYTAPVARCGGESCGPIDTTGSVRVLNLDGTGEPNVLLKLYSGGAHCCEIDQVFTYDPGTMTYSRAQYDFGNYGERLVQSDGRWLFETANDAFAYAFTDYAASGAPIQFLSFAGGKFTDVTRSYPAAITKDAAVWMKAFKAQAPKYTDTTGLVAAWAADEDLLGQSATVAQFLQAQAAAKHLNTPLHSLGGLPQNAKYVTALNKFLKKLGYLT